MEDIVKSGLFALAFLLCLVLVAADKNNDCKDTVENIPTVRIDDDLYKTNYPEAP